MFWWLHIIIIKMDIKNGLFDASILRLYMVSSIFIESVYQMINFIEHHYTSSRSLPR